MLWTCLCRGIPGGVSGFQLPITRRRGRQSVQGTSMWHSCKWQGGEHAKGSQGRGKQRLHTKELKPRVSSEHQWVPQLTSAETVILIRSANTQDGSSSHAIPGRDSTQNSLGMCMRGRGGDRQRARAPSICSANQVTISKKSTHLSESRDTRFSSGLWLRAV